MKKKSRSRARAIRKLEDSLGGSASLEVIAAKARVCHRLDRIRAKQAAGNMKSAYRLLVGMAEDVKLCRDLPFLRAYRMLVALRGPKPEPARRLLLSILGNPQ
jgi:hypothetical protein